MIADDWKMKYGRMVGIRDGGGGVVIVLFHFEFYSPPSPLPIPTK